MASLEKAQQAQDYLKQTFESFAQNFGLIIDPESENPEGKYLVTVSDADNAPDGIRTMLIKGSVSGHNVFIKRANDNIKTLNM